MTGGSDMKYLFLLFFLSALSLCAEPAWTGDSEKTLYFSSDSRHCNQLETLAEFDLTRLRGKTLTFHGSVKLNGVSKPPRADLGAKFMFIIKKKHGTVYPGCRNLNGTTDWRPIRFSCLIPPDAEKGTLVCGIQQSTGTVQFRNLSMNVEDLYPAPVLLPDNFRCEYSQSEKQRPVQRGFMTPFAQHITQQDLRDMADLGANLIRWQLTAPDKTANDPAAYRDWLDNQLKRLKNFLPECERLGLSVIIDMHAPPGKRLGKAALLGTAGAEAAAAYGNSALHKLAVDDTCYHLFLESWEKIAELFRNEKSVLGYDLINEPVQLYRTKRDYLAIQYEAAKIIRSLDPEKPIFVESNDWCSPASFVYLHPLPLKNIIYQVHMYDPGAYTHQGLAASPAGPLKHYPGIINGVRYDKNHLRQVLAPVVDFQKKYGAKILVGEFSATRWSPGAERYLADLTELFEEFGWDWTYHAFRESDAWDAEIASTKPERIMDHRKRIEARNNPAASARLDILKKAFLKNRRKTR